MERSKPVRTKEESEMSSREMKVRRMSVEETRNIIPAEESRSKDTKVPACAGPRGLYSSPRSRQSTVVTRTRTLKNWLMGSTDHRVPTPWEWAASEIVKPTMHSVTMEAIQARW